MGRVSAVLLLAAAVALSVAAAPVRGAGGCVLWAGPTGSDSAAGTAAAPLRTLGHLFATLKPGQTGCVLEGTRFDEHVRVTRPNVHVQVFGRPATLNGRLRFARDSAGSSLENVVVRGDGPGRGVIVAVAANGVVLTNLDVSGPNYVNGRATCVRIGGANVTVHWLHVHDCTTVTSKHVYAPGIVVAGRGARVVDNVVYNVPGDGIAVGPNARGVVVAHNVLEGNATGVRVHGPSSGRIVDNVITYSGQWNVHGDGTGTGVVVTGNCLWGSTKGDIGGSGFRAYRNLVRQPRFADRTSFRVVSGPCAAKGPRVATQKPKITPPPTRTTAPKRTPPAPSVLPRFLVQYTLRALPSRVQFISLSFTGLTAGAAVEIRCTRGCNAHETLTAAPGGTAFSSGLGGRWFALGTVITVRETLRGRRGAYARIVVTGLPRGVRVTHGVLG